MAEKPNPAQLAPGQEAAEPAIDIPFIGWQPNGHIGYPLNRAFDEGASTGRA